jgi:hypothetical protein
VYKALTIVLDGSLKTPNIHSEIVCSLSASNNVCHCLCLCLCRLDPTSIVNHTNHVVLPHSCVDIRSLSAFRYHRDFQGRRDCQSPFPDRVTTAPTIP